MRYWLMKSEPDEFSIDDLARSPRRTTSWFGVRNYQARNFMRDGRKVGDLALFYHSSCPDPGVAGIVRVSAPAHPDATQFDPTSKYYDPASPPADPRWDWVTIAPVRKLPFVSLDELRSLPELEQSRLLAKGNRLSVLPLADAEFDAIVAFALRRT